MDFTWKVTLQLDTWKLLTSQIYFKNEELKNVDCTTWWCKHLRPSTCKVTIRIPLPCWRHFQNTDALLTMISRYTALLTMIARWWRLHDADVLVTITCRCEPLLTMIHRWRSLHHADTSFTMIARMLMPCWRWLPEHDDCMVLRIFFHDDDNTMLLPCLEGLLQKLWSHSIFLLNTSI